MLFGIADIELLRLLGWCKNLPTDIHRKFGARIFGPQEIGAMEALGLVFPTGNGACIRLRPRGWRLLRAIGCGYHEDAGYISEYGRRIEVARILLAFYRAGFNVYVDQWQMLADPGVFLQSPAARRNASAAGDLLGGSVFHGMANISGNLCACYYVGPYRFHHRNDRQILNKASLAFHCNPSILLAATSYFAAARAIRKPKRSADPEDGKQGFHDIYRDTPYPLHLLECSDAGALQLRMMSRENYRMKLGAQLLQVQQPVPGVRDADGLTAAKDADVPCPCVIGVDMDVKRIDRVLGQTMTAGFPCLVVLCLEQQRNALEHLYAKENPVEVRAISGETLGTALGDLTLYEPIAAPYTTQGGGVLDATNLPVD